MPKYSRNEAKILKMFGESVREKRDTLHVSQEELADRVGLHRTYIGGIEQGRRNVSLLNILKIAQALEVRPGEMLDAIAEREERRNMP